MNFLFVVLLFATTLWKQGFSDHIQDDLPDEPAEPHLRGKRFILTATGQLWPGGVVPYKYDSQLKKAHRNDYEKYVFPVYKKYSCLKFVPWTENTKTAYNLTHDNFLTFVQSNQCVSKIGYARTKGQKISCCTWSTCLHELAHAVGMRHEHTKPIRDEFVRINYENIKSGLADQFKRLSTSAYENKGLYDFDSIMHYGYKAWSKNGKKTITPLDSDMQKSSDFEDTDTFYYLFKEINKVYSCTANCNILCENGGYNAMVNGKCKCRCPEGLDSATNCRTLLKRDYNCGKIIALDDSIPTAEFDSPNITGISKPKMCHWFIKSPPNSRIILNFPKFDIRSQYKRCIDEVAIRYLFPGLHGVQFCGNMFKKTIRSYGNIVGVSFTQTPGTISSFRATVTFVYDKDMCYTVNQKGHFYNGNVSHADDSSLCLDWSKVQQCRHHLFNVGDLNANLKENFCRNPDKATSPWCYTNKETCSRRYCDACQIGVCKDIFTNCKSEIKNNNRFCNDDIEAPHGCRRSCGFCDKFQRLPSVSGSTCGKPDVPNDAVNPGSLRAAYMPGNTVTFSCNSSADTQTIRCLADGTWTPLKFICGACMSGWYSFLGQCYKLFPDMKNKNMAKSSCANARTGSTLVAIPSPKVHEFITSLARSQSRCEAVWLGLSKVDDVWKWNKGSRTVDWTSWANDTSGKQSCAALTSGCMWRDRPCSSKFKFICQYTKPTPMICADQRLDCHSVLENNPDVCSKQMSFVDQCSLTCGVCKTTQSQNVVCSDEGNAKNVFLSSSSVPLGKYIAYKCVPGNQYLSGQMKRACAVNGKLTGVSPVCQSDKVFSFPVNKLSMYERTSIGQTGYAYVAANDFHVIPKNGKLVKWTIYTNYNGQIGLQVWRKTSTGNSFKLIGQNAVTKTREGGQMTIVVPTDNRITVLAGDLIGVFYPNYHGGLSYDKCNKMYVDGGNQFVSIGVQTKLTGFKRKRVYDFKKLPSGDCKVFSLNAYVVGL